MPIPNTRSNKINRLTRKRDYDLCQVCGSYGDEVHHILPICYNGADELENTILLCKLCHKHAPNKPEEFEEYKLSGGIKRIIALGIAVNTYKSNNPDNIPLEHCIEMAEISFNAMRKDTHSGSIKNPCTKRTWQEIYSDFENFQLWA